MLCLRNSKYGKYRKFKSVGIILLFALTTGIWFVIINIYTNQNYLSTRSIRPSRRVYYKWRDCVVLTPKSPNATQQVLPQSIIIGVRKAGTTALKTYLRLHPKIVIAEKEPNFFSLKYDRGIEWYRQCMPFSEEGQITMEKSSNNFHNTRAPERMYMYYANSSVIIKLIVIAREPVERAISDFTQRVVIQKNLSTFSEMFTKIIEESDTPDFNSILPSLYYKHMRRWLKYFPLEQIHIVDGNNLIANPYEEVYKVESFLGIEHQLDKNRFYFNKTKGFYCFRNETMDLECLKKSKGRKHVSIDKNIIKKLRQYFKPLNKDFFDLIDRKFEW